jgi:hypothetical protein
MDRRGVRAALIICLAFLIPAHNASAQAPARDRTRIRGSGTIRGHVRSVENAPLRRVIVRIRGTGLQQPRAVMTDDGGDYELTNLPPGRYSVTASKNGYLNGSAGQGRPAGPAVWIEMAEGQILDPVDIVLWRAGAISGRVLDEYGDPVTGVMVSVLANRTVQGQLQLMPAGRPSEPSDDTGAYRVFGLPPGRYTLVASMRPIGAPMTGAGVAVVSRDQLGYAPTYYPGTADSASASFLDIEVGQTLTDINLPLASMPLARVAGAALDSLNRPVERNGLVRIVKDGTAPTNGMPQLVSPVRNGAFAIDGVPPGQYVVQLTISEPGGPREFGSTAITVNGADVTGVQVAAVPPSLLRGRFVFEPRLGDRVRPATLRPLSLRAEPGTGSMMPGMPPKVHDDFSFELPVFAGLYNLSASISDPNIVVRSIRIGGTDVTDRPVLVGTGDAFDDVEIELTDRVTEISGTLTDPQAAAQFSVIVFPRDPTLRNGPRRVASGRPDQYGRFTIRAMLPGEYYVVALREQPAEGYTNEPFLDRIQQDATLISIAEGEHRTIALPLVEEP